MDVVFVDGDDWDGLYVDGVLKDEGHRVSVVDALRAVGVNCCEKYPNMKWLRGVGNFPERLSEVKFVQ